MSESGARQQAGAGVLSVVQAVANPAAGADWSTSPTATRQLLSVFATLATSATAGNRLPTLQVSDNAGHTLLSLSVNNLQAASLTETYIWGVGMPFAGANNQNTAPIPSGLVVASNWTIRAVANAILAGDQWSAIVLTFAG